MSGRFAMKRGWRENAMFRGEPFNKACAWVWMIERACFQPTKFDINGKIVTLQRSQFCSSIRQLADAWGWSKSAVDRFLTRLKTETMIETDVGTGKLIITICNYDKHQFEPKNIGTASGTPSGTGAGQERDTKEEVNKEIRDNTSVLSCDDHVRAWLEWKSKKPKKNRKSEPFDEDRFGLPADMPNPEWADYVAMRRAIRKPIKTMDGANGIVSELRRLAEDGHPPGHVLRQSVAFEYQGVFPLKTGRVTNGNGNYHNQPDEPHGLEKAIAKSRAERFSQQPEFL